MTKTKILTVLALGIATTAQSSAWAAKAKPLESYSATDGEEPRVMKSEPKAIAPQSKATAKTLPTQKKVSLEMRVDALEKELVDLRRRNQTVASALQPTAPTYDDVPTEQVESISDRIQLVEDILNKHGRAYDYRAHTTQSLKTILAQLDAAAAEKEAANEEDLELDIPTESSESDNS